MFIFFKSRESCSILKLCSAYIILLKLGLNDVTNSLDDFWMNGNALNFALCHGRVCVCVCWCMCVCVCWCVCVLVRVRVCVCVCCCCCCD